MSGQMRPLTEIIFQVFQLKGYSGTSASNIDFRRTRGCARQFSEPLANAELILYIVSEFL